MMWDKLDPALYITIVCKKQDILTNIILKIVERGWSYELVGGRTHHRVMVDAPRQYRAFESGRTPEEALMLGYLSALEQVSKL